MILKKYRNFKDKICYRQHLAVKRSNFNRCK